jgi:hypothetical protein
MESMRKCVFCALLLLLVSPAFATNWYVWKSATGSNNGTNWTNAWEELSSINFSSVACGDTIWIGGGVTYTTNLTISKTCTSSTVLTIQSVLSTDSVPTSAPGYVSSILNQVLVSNGFVTLAGGANYTISGRAGNAGTGVPYGIQFSYTSSGIQAFLKGGSISNVTLAYLEIIGPSCVPAQTCTGITWGVTTDGNSSHTDTNMLIDHVWLHRFAETLRLYESTGLTVQYCYIGEDYTEPQDGSVDHADLVYESDPVSNLTMRYNHFYTSENDGVWWDNNAVTNLYFYDNIVYHSGGWLMGWPRVPSNNGPVYVYNNIFENDGTFGDYSPAFIGFDTSGSSFASGSGFVNNIYYQVAANGGTGGFPLSQFQYNAFDSASSPGSCTGCFTFTDGSPLNSFNAWVNMSSSNPIAADFHLTAAGATLFAGKGENLGAPYNVDMDGNTRPATGAWALGPYENGNSQAAPTNLTLVVH